MILRVGLESNMDARWMAWALDHPGCYSYGETGDQALMAMPAAFQEYGAWFANHLGSDSWLDIGGAKLVLEETWEGYFIDESFGLAEDGIEINAWFRDDWKPLKEEDVRRGLEILGWTRSDLLNLVGRLDERILSVKQEGERWDINGILRHIGAGEWWYLDRLGLAFPEHDLEEDAYECLKQVRACLVEHLPGLVGLHQVVGLEGEIWSPRKLLRRAIWHERDHTVHICRVTAGV